MEFIKTINSTKETSDNKDLTKKKVNKKIITRKLR